MPGTGCPWWFCLPVLALGELPAAALDVPGAGCSEHGAMGNAVNQQTPSSESPAVDGACLIEPLLALGLEPAPHLEYLPGSATSSPRSGLLDCLSKGCVAGWAPTLAEQMSALKLGQDNVSCVFSLHASLCG